MAQIQNPNLELLSLAVERLGELTDAMVFLGGCATGLLITDPAAPPVRMTRDVDAIVQVLSLADYRQLEKQLRVQGFSEDTRTNAPICRWVGGLVKELATRFRALLNDRQFIQAVSGHMPTDAISQARVPMILQVIKQLAMSNEVPCD